MASRAPPSARRAAAASPAGWLAAYDDFITKNVGQVSQIESTLRSLTYIVPGRFRDAEMASEAIHAGVQLLALYHDQLLQRVAAGRAAGGRTDRGPGGGPLLSATPGPPPSPHTRYTRYWTHKSPLYRRAAVALQVLRYTELLCEMAAKRRGERVRWRVVVLIEAAKALCRLLLLRVTGGRTTVEPPLPERQALGVGEEEEDADDDEVEEGKEQEADDNVDNTNTHAGITDNNTPPTPPLSPVSASKSLSPPAAAAAGHRLPPSPPSTTAGAGAAAAAPPHQPWPMPRTGLALPPLPQPGDITGYLLSRVLTADAIRPPTTLLRRPRGPAPLAAEVLHILVPLVYALALAQTARARQQKQSKVAAWAPWLAGVAMETAARQLRARDGLRTTTLERDEWTRRGWALGWWAMRGAAYEQAVQGVVAGVRARLPGFVAGIVEDYEYLWANYYFSTSP